MVAVRLPWLWLPVLLAVSGCAGRMAGAAADAPPPPPPPPAAAAPSPPDDMVYESAGAEPPRAAPQIDGERKKNYAVVPVYFATDRKPIAGEPGRAVFGTQRGSMSYGLCEVSIPHDHEMGMLEAPSIWKFEFRQDPAKHVVLLSTRVENAERFYEDLAQRVRATRRKSAFVFVHGYNVTFEDAARRTAQISYDLRFDGAPVFYSWPSQGRTPGYTIDEQNVEWAEANLRNFLGDFFDRSGANDVYLIAHSMGNRALTGALATLVAQRPAIRTRLKEVILTAPDIDAEVFRRDIAPALASSGRPVTLYASADDKALLLSKQVHGYARAGDAGPGLVIVQGVETIDATGMDAGFLGHSYYGDNRSVLSDIYYVMRDGKRANDRFGLEPKDTSRGRYWVFKP